MGDGERQGRKVMKRISLEVETVAEAYLGLLKARGIDYLFANAGTDFAPIIEALVRGQKAGIAMPEPLAIAHETVAVAMAHGYYLLTGRPQAVMVHVNVGMANALMGLLNAARDNVPILFTSGRTPLTEAGRLGSRDLPIHWGQEMRDQGGMLREYVKWDYELRFGEQLEAIVDRALAIAMGAPRGPVYLSLPREALAAPLPGLSFADRPRLTPAAPPHPAPDAIDEAAVLLARAERPLIVTSRAGRDPGAFEALADLALRFAIPVVEFWPQQASLPTDHPMHGGFDVGPWLAEADCVLVLDALVPWIPSRHALPEGCKVIQIGPDPLFSGLPVRSFAADVAIASTPGVAIRALSAALDIRAAAAGDARRSKIREKTRELREARLADAEAGRALPMTQAWVSRCLDRIKGEESIVVNELGCDPSVMTFTRPDSLFGHSLAGGLGWGLPAALGARLACPDRPVIAAIGDGSYLFANPVACHQVAAALELPLLTIVFNNGRWDAVRKSTLSVYPDGHAARANRMPLTSLAPSPAYERIVAACGGHGELVEDPEALPAALERALQIVQTERRQALLNVICR
jgi:acetolactate synthase-1/2/3 large subunit